MAVPKRRHSASRGKKRRTHWKLKHPGIANCGYYAGEEVFVPKSA
jgi:ribosomal protein L32